MRIVIRPVGPIIRYVITPVVTNRGQVSRSAGKVRLCCVHHHHRRRRLCSLSFSLTHTSLRMSSSTETLSNLKEAAQSVMSTRRPWREFLSLYAIGFPSSLSEATTRIGINLTRFLFNYTFIFVFILLLSLVYHPFAILLIVLAVAGWYFLFFARDAAEPFTLFNLVAVDDRVLVVALAIFTVVVIAATGVWVNVVVSVLVAAAVVCLHGALRRTDEGIVDDYESPYGPMLGDSNAGPYAPV